MRLALALLLAGCATGPVTVDGGACEFDPAEIGDWHTVWRSDVDGGQQTTRCFYLIDCFTTLGCSHADSVDGGR